MELSKFGKNVEVVMELGGTKLRDALITRQGHPKVEEVISCGNDREKENRMEDARES